MDDNMKDDDIINLDEEQDIVDLNENPTNNDDAENNDASEPSYEVMEAEPKNKSTKYRKAVNKRAMVDYEEDNSVDEGLQKKSIKKKKDTKNSSKKSDKKVADNKKKSDTKKNKDALKALSNNDKKKSSKKVIDSTSKSKKTDKKNNKKLSKKKSIDMIIKNKGSIAKNISAKKQYEMTVSEELQKVTSNKSTEQMKKPKRIVFMIFFYVAIIFAIAIFCIIKFTKPHLISSMFKDKLIKEKIVVVDDDIIESSDESETLKTSETVKTGLKPIVIDKSLLENGKKEVVKDEKEIETKKVIEEESDNSNSKSIIKETTKAPLKETTKEAIKEITKETTKETTKVVAKETTKKVAKKEINVNIESEEMNETIPPKQKVAGIAGILPKYKEVLYSQSMYNQFSTEELGVIYKVLEFEFQSISNKIFGSGIDFETKGRNGIIYLNYSAIQNSLLEYSAAIFEEYGKLPQVPYYKYLMNVRFGYNYDTYTTNLMASIDFKNAKDMGLYYEIPATFYEPKGKELSTGGKKAVKLRVLKKSKVGFTESFLLQAELEILDKECNTKINPYFDIEDTIGPYPRAASIMRSSQFRIDESLQNTKFNYIIFDKKGYVTGIYNLES